MHNPETDKYELVEINPPKERRPLFGPKPAAIKGFSDEVLGSMVLRINQGTRTFPLEGNFTDNLTTRDGHHPGYLLKVRFWVKQSDLFARLYYQSSDPVKIMREEIEKALHEFAKERIYTQLVPEDLLARNEVRRLGYNPENIGGITISDVPQLQFTADPRLGKIIDIKKATDVRVTQAEQDGRLQDTKDGHDIAHTSKMEAARRAEEANEQLHKLKLAAATRFFEKELSIAIRELEDGVPPIEVLGRHPKIRTHIEEIIGEIDTPRLPPAQETRAITSPQEVTIDHLGITLTPITLNAKTVQLHELGSNRAFMVSSFEEDGPAHRAGVKLGHILLQINGKVLGNPETIEALVLDGAPNEPMRLLVLRDEEKITLEI